MPLKKCYECRKEISTKAEICPNCGAPQGKEYEKERLKELLEKEASHTTSSSRSRVAYRERQKEQKRYNQALIRYLVITMGAMIIGGYIYMNLIRSDTPSTTKQKIKKSFGYLQLKATMLYDGSQFTITNNDNFDWRNVKFDVNAGLVTSGYTLETPLIEAGQTYTVGLMQFSKGDGTRLNPLVVKVKKMSIFCDTRRGRGSWHGSWE